ncbi:MAG: hypothetical protein PUG67_06345 [Peptoniphilaceae bacterium]|nr:hypothetical protein [Peptoniphilaceae bacterium]MDY6018130.1 hypothetical protein [Anaerococcus sp.]
MKKYIRERALQQKYSLHDANIIDIYIDKNDLILETDEGYIDIENDRQVKGKIRIEDISFDNSYVYLLTYKKVLCGNPGKFKGEKMLLKKFIKKFKKGKDHLDIIEESDLYKTIKLQAFYTHKSNIKEANFEIFYRGDFVYELED